MNSLPQYTLTREIHDSAGAVLYRGYRNADRVPVAVKLLKSEYPTPREIAKMRHEHAITRDLAITGVARAYDLEKVGGGLAFVTADLPGEPLSDVLQAQRLDLRSALRVTIALADILEQIHRQNIIHKQITPHNIMVDLATQEVQLINFGIASRLDRETQRAGSPDALEGNLAYMAPEQTGRMNRVIDRRSDLYSLGVTFYEMLTGVLPFSTTDPVELVHSHIARRPAPPHEIAPGVPAALSDIVMKLLSKAAEDRYQRAYGLKADLEISLSALEATGTIAPFPLGRRDLSGDLRIPQKLYGREAAIEDLLAAWRRVGRGASELLLVSGYPGVGKSALVKEIHKAIAQRRGYFIAGKFDQLSRSTPYAGVGRAFRELIRHLLTERPEVLARWKSKLLAAVGPNGKVLIDVIPEVELVIGPQPAVPALGPTESQNRFSVVFQGFVRLFTTEECPLAVFLDDLQWADPASLKLLQLLLTDPESTHLLLVGAYRDNEVAAPHPLLDTLAEIRRAGSTVTEITLKPLDLADVGRLVADTVGGDAERCAPLARTLSEKTQGNPFFLGQFLTALHQEKLLTLDESRGAWVWDLERIQQRMITDNVVELMTSKIQRLAPSTQRALRFASCIGHQFDLRVLAVVCEKPPLEMAADLWEALQEGLVLPLDADYRFLPTRGDRDPDDAAPASHFDVSYGFLHDRVQQAAYSLIEEEKKQEVHLRIGQLLRAKDARHTREEDLFDVVHHLNLGAARITDPEERADLARLNLDAGQKAKAATAYHAAARYLGAGIALLGEGGWERDYDLTFALHASSAECGFLSGHFDEAEPAFEALLARGRGALERAQIQNMRAVLYCTVGKFQEAVSAGCAGLALLGVDVPGAPAALGAALGAELAEVEATLARRSVEEIYLAPELTDPAIRLALEILMNLVSPTFVVNHMLFFFVNAKQMNLSLKHGHSDVSAYAYMAYAATIGIVLKGGSRYQEAFAIGKLSLDLNEKFGRGDLTCKLYCFFGMLVHLVEPLRGSLAHFSRAYQGGLESGDFNYIARSCLFGTVARFALGEELGAVRDEVDKFTAAVRRTGELMSLTSMQIAKQAIASLTGGTRRLGSFEDGQFDEVRLRAMVDKMGPLLATWYFTVKLLLAVIAEDHADALPMVSDLEKIFATAGGTYPAFEAVFYLCLNLTAAYPAATADERAQYAEALARHRDKIAGWAASSPATFRHKELAVAAEWARVAGNPVEAMDLYDQAVKAAWDGGYVHHQAIINELAAKFYLGIGREKVARVYLTEARAGYRAWGATAKVAALDEKYGASIGLEGADGSVPAPAAVAIDLVTVLKASQALSGEIDLGRLLDRLMTIVIENAGAERGYLILIRGRGDDLFIDAEVSVEAREVKVFERGAAPSAAVLPSSILNYVRRTRQNVILDDAAAEARFAGDEYIARERPKSVLCMPLVRQAELVALIYLENNLTTGAFTPERLAVLEMLSSQAAISLENATLYAEVQQENAERRRAEEEVRKLNSELELRVLDRTAQLSVANKELEAFSFTVSHDLRAPLRAIDGFSQALWEESGQELPPSSRDHLDRVRKASGRMSELIEDMLSLSRVTRTEMNRQRVDLSAIAREVAAELRRANPGREGVECVIAAGITVDGDARLLRAALENLLGNAWKFTGKHARARIEVGTIALPDGRRAYFVRDDGAGFDMKLADKLFDAFQRLHSSAEFAGTGIGLATVARIVKRHGGDIWAEGAPGAGATFYFTL